MHMSKPSTHPRADLRRASDHRWVARDLDDPSIVWTWQPYSDSWDRRERYDPNLGALESLPTVDAFRAFNTGWPGARPAPRVAPEELRAHRIAVLVSAETYARVQRFVQTANKSVSSWINELIIEALAVASSSATPDDESRAELPPS